VTGIAPGLLAFFLGGVTSKRMTRTIITAIMIPNMIQTIGGNVSQKDPEVEDGAAETTTVWFSVV
jgi:hypothetical protein